MRELPRKLGYQPSLDGLRAVAIGLVVLTHYAAFPAAGFLGVDLFFVLSGFLITVLLLEEQQTHGSISIGRFYARRALRLVPALWAMLAVYAVVSLASGDAPHNVLLTLLYALTYTMNVAIALGANAGIALSHLWSLAVEEQFYLVWPALLLVALRRRVPWRVLAAALLAAAVTIAAVRFALRPAHIPIREDAGSVTRFDSILVGCVFGLGFASAAQSRLLAAARNRVVLPVAVAFAAWILFADAGKDFFYQGKSLFFALAVGVILLAAVSRGDGDRPPVLALLASPPLVFVGRISYALYLWQSPLLQWEKDANLAAHVGQVASRAAALAVAVGAATASHYLVERPFLRLKWRLARTSSHDVPLERAVHSEGQQRVVPAAELGDA